MNVKEYISSGILEAYVIGELSVEERVSVEQNLSLYPELRTALGEIEETQEKLLKQIGITPGDQLKANILNSISFNDGETKVVSLQSEQQPNYWKWAAAASIAIALVASYLAFDYRGRWREAQELALLNKAESERMASQYNRVKNMEQELQIVADPGMKKVVMHGTDKAPDAMATVYWGESSEHVFLKVNKMSKLENNYQYQLWAMVNGKPVDAGVFNANDSGMIQMKNIGKGATTFAVTIEPRGGNSSPTLATMQVAGNV